LDGVEAIERHIALIAIANGRYFGGGMMIAPDAELGDGLFDVVVLRGEDKLKLLSDLRLVYSGAHKGHTFVTIRRAANVLVEPLGDPVRNAALLEIDGESPGAIPARFEVLPGALTLRA
jgi:diacylglycerol kinase family enzyme